MSKNKGAKGNAKEEAAKKAVALAKRLKLMMSHAKLSM